MSAAVSLLDDEYSRRVVGYFQAAENEVATLRELVDSVIAREDSSPDRERIAIRLHHATLPKLDEVGLLEYDARNHDVRYEGDDFLESWLDEQAVTVSELDDR